MRLFWQTNKLLIVVFFALSAFSIFQIVNEEAYEKPKTLAEILKESDNLHAKNRADRFPAAIDSQGLIVPKSVNQKLSLQAFCKPEALRLQLSEHLITLEISSCIDLKEKHQLWVKNETNGFKAQIFKLEGAKFKTDFIQLNKGMNKLVLEGILKDGQKVVQTLEILSGS